MPRVVTRSRHVRVEEARPVVTPADQAQLLTVYRGTFTAAAARAAARREGRFAASETLGLFVDGALVAAGTFLAHGATVEIALFGVKRSVRGGGVGRRMAHALFAYAAERLGRRLQRFVLNADDASGAVRFWESLGFRRGRHAYAHDPAGYGNTVPMVRKK